LRFAGVVALLLLAGVALAGDVETQLDAPQKATYQKLCESLVAPCCWRESLALHRSPESLKSRDEIAAMIAAGKSEREIRNDFVARYGTRVLIEPEGGRSRWLYLIPILALGAAVAAALRFLVSRVRDARTAQPSAAAVDDSEWEW
jgi:cytochrome c-type biogenesis protein CcmH/NrfF